MTTPLSKVVNVLISRTSSFVTVTGFGRANIMGAANRFVDKFRLYTDLAGMLADGFLSSDPEYKAAASLIAQPQRPVDFMVSKRSAATAQVSHVVVSALANANYVVTLNGTAYTYTPGGIPADKTTVVTALKALIDADLATIFVAATLTGAGANKELDLTSTIVGLAFTAAVGANLTLTLPTPSNGVGEDIASLSLASGGDDWFGLVLTSHNSDDIRSGAAYIETLQKILIGCNSEAGVLTNGAGNIAAYLKAKKYNNTAYFYSADGNFPEAALFGALLTLQPGSASYDLVQLVGIVADGLTATQTNNLDTNNATYFVTIGGLDVTQGGKVAGGEWLDIISGDYWLAARIQEEVFRIMTNLPKVPFTDDGLSIISNGVRKWLSIAEGNSVNLLVVGSSKVVQPAASSYSSADKQARTLANNPITFSAEHQGAIQNVTIKGTIAV